MIYFSKREIEFINFYNANNKEVFFCLFYLCKKYPDGVYDFNKKLNKIIKHRIKNEDIVNIIGEKGTEKPFYVYISSFNITLKLNDFMYNLFDYNDLAFKINNNEEYYNELVLYYKKYLNPQKYICCEKCDKIIEKSSNNIKYCKKCAKIVKNEKNKLRVRKHRMNII